ncbi:hypothetical protein QR680_011610 [Steinernema hermaphroditum]|uniref:LITAF domain-containing protein n=1 Tax=Steinernema hermaphroditum TaxID=289476 RepID=A0AA39HZ31_9BILA|nr:hypothetical protein QR680_011610 [Steinernema hermaphroditum]
MESRSDISANMQQDEPKSPDLGQTGFAVQCPGCKRDIYTFVSKRRRWRFWLVFVLLVLLVQWYAAVLLCDDFGLKDTVHSCPFCKTVIGIAKREKRKKKKASAGKS